MEQQVVFIVWRESVEALLVVGILYTWLRKTPEGCRGLPWLWGGVLCGAALAGSLALVLLGISRWLTSEGEEWFQAVMALAACALVVQMVYWMRQHGRTLKKDLEGGADRELERSNWWGLLLLVSIAVAREGSETVVFLYGTVSAGVSNGSAFKLALAGLFGFIAALGSFWLLQLGGKLLTWRRFFQITEILLLLLASSLLVTGTDHLISLEILPTLMDPIWDSSHLLSTEGGLGKVLADFAGYRELPALSQLLTWMLYWIFVWTLLRRTKQNTARRPQPSSVSA